jgi:hypothetical protein
MASSAELYFNVADILEYKPSSDICSSDTRFIAPQLFDSVYTHYFSQLVLQAECINVLIIGDMNVLFSKAAKCF